MVASGFAGLGYQIVWTQQCALWLGHETPAALAVVTGFFGGLAVGAWALGARIQNSMRPVRWYAGCEFAIGLWSLVLVFAMPSFSSWALGLIGPEPAPAWQWSVAFCGTFLVLLPATAAIGATLPAMERITQSFDERRSIAPLYASNTAGAVIGVLAAAFWLVPEIDLMRTAYGSNLQNSRFLGWTASACLDHGRLELARRLLDEAVEVTAGEGERYWVSELHRLRARLLRAEGAPAADVTAAIDAALDVARTQGAKTFEQRALDDQAS